MLLTGSGSLRITTAMRFEPTSSAVTVLTIYESVRADLTSQDVEMYVGYGEYQVQYQMVGNELYTPLGPVEGLQSIVGFDRYSAEQMQQNLFFDPGVTRTISDRSGSQIYTDGKRGLQVEQNGKWINYTDPVAGQKLQDDESDNVYASSLSLISMAVGTGFTGDSCRNYEIARLCDSSSIMAPIRLCRKISSCSGK